MRVSLRYPTIFLNDLILAYFAEYDSDEDRASQKIKVGVINKVREIRENHQFQVG